MAIRIQVHNVVIQVDTGEDLKLVLETLRASNGNAPVKPLMPTRHVEAGLRDFGKFYKQLPTNQQNLLRALRQSVNGKTDSQLRTELHLASNMHLAGLMAGVAKNAKKAGFSFEEILTKERRGKPGDRVYYYRLTAAMLEAIPGELPLN